MDRSLWYLARRHSYAEFREQLDHGTRYPGERTPAGRGEILHSAMLNSNPRDRLLIANRLLDDGADASLISDDGDFVNVFHALWGRERERDVVGEAALVGRLLDGGADINYRSRRFGLPLVMMMQATPSNEYLRTMFKMITEHAHPDLTLPTDRRRIKTVGQSLARNRFGFMRDDVVAYAAATGQDIGPIDQAPPPGA